MKKVLVFLLVFSFLFLIGCQADGDVASSSSSSSSSSPSGSGPSEPPVAPPTAELVTYDYQANEAMAPTRQDTYATKDGYNLPLNIYAPAEDNVNSKTAVLCIHGGAWAGGDKAEEELLSLYEILL